MTTRLSAHRVQAALSATQLAALHTTPVELAAAPAATETIMPLAATLRLRGGSPGQAGGYSNRENVVIGWLDEYESGGMTVPHRPQWGRTTLDALIRAAQEGPQGPAFAVLVENRFLWQPGIRPGKALALWLTEALTPVPGNAALDAEVYYVVSS